MYYVVGGYIYENAYAYYKEDATRIPNYVLTRHIAFAIMIYSESISLLNNKYNRKNASTYKDGCFRSPMSFPNHSIRYNRLQSSDI